MDSKEGGKGGRGTKANKVKSWSHLLLVSYVYPSFLMIPPPRNTICGHATTRTHKFALDFDTHPVFFFWGGVFSIHTNYPSFLYVYATLLPPVSFIPNQSMSSGLTCGVRGLGISSRALFVHIMCVCHLTGQS